MKIKKPYLLVGIILILLLVVLLIVKLSTKNDLEIVVDPEVKAASFIPANKPEVSADEKVKGSTKADVKIVVYEDYANVFSADNSENIKKLEAEFGNKIMVAVRPYVLRQKTMSLESAMAIECASEQGKWEEMRDGVFNAVRSGNLNMDGISGWAKQIDLDMDKFNQCLTDVKKQGIMLQETADAQKFSVYGAPTVFVNDELVVGARPYEDYTDESGVSVLGLKSLVARELAK